jgi:hypothetical protein
MPDRSRRFETGENVLADSVAGRRELRAEIFAAHESFRQIELRQARFWRQATRFPSGTLSTGRGDTIRVALPAPICRARPTCYHRSAHNRCFAALISNKEGPCRSANLDVSGAPTRRCQGGKDGGPDRI